MKRLVFLDRDGTLNIDHGYVFQPERVELVSGAAEAISSLKEAGYYCVITSNQSAIGRGMCTEEDVISTNRQLEKLLAGENPGALIDEFRFSPDAPGQSSVTRKPQTGMISDFLDQVSALTFVVGDKLSDVEFGINAGLAEKNCFLVLTGQGKDSSEEVAKRFPDAKIVESIVEAKDEILRCSQKENPSSR